MTQTYIIWLSCSGINCVSCSTQVLLNKEERASADPVILHEPSHVSLHHLYAQSIRENMLVLSSTTRYEWASPPSVLATWKYPSYRNMRISQFCINAGIRAGINLKHHSEVENSILGIGRNASPPSSTNRWRSPNNSAEVRKSVCIMVMKIIPSHSFLYV